VSAERDGSAGLFFPLVYPPPRIRFRFAERFTFERGDIIEIDQTTDAVRVLRRRRGPRRRRPKVD
jgi:hypothetical protein